MRDAKYRDHPLQLQRLKLMPKLENSWHLCLTTTSVDFVGAHLLPLLPSSPNASSCSLRDASLFQIMLRQARLPTFGLPTSFSVALTATVRHTPAVPPPTDRGQYEIQKVTSTAVELVGQSVRRYRKNPPGERNSSMSRLSCHVRASERN